MANLRPHFTAGRDDWATPMSVIRRLEYIFDCEFDTDPCAGWWHEYGYITCTAKAPFYYVAPGATAGLDIPNLPPEDGLAPDNPWPGDVFVNPPYGRGIGKWFDKAIAEFDAGRATSVTMLLPARTDTKWWHKYVLGKHADPITVPWHVLFVEGRIHFDGAPAGAPFPSVILHYGHSWRRNSGWVQARIYGSVRFSREAEL